VAIVIARRTTPRMLSALPVPRRRMNMYAPMMRVMVRRAV
jgi:hypothetical protein